MSLPLPSPRRMRRLWSWSATERGLACAMLLLATALFVGAMQHARWSAEQQADATASHLAATVQQDVARNLELLDLTLRATIGGLELPAIQALSTETRSQLLFDRTPRDRYVSFIEALNEKGDVIAASPPPQYGENWANRDYFIALRSGTADELFIGRPFATTHDDTAAIPIGRRITDQNGKFAELVVIGLRLAYFRDLFNQLALGPHSSVALLRDDGVILMRLPFDLNDIGRTLDATAPFSTFKRDGSALVPAADAIDHVERRFTFRRVGNLPLVVSIGVADDAGYGVWLADLWLLLLSFGTLSTLLVMLLGWLSRERRQCAAAEHESREKSRFLTTLSHELRTPLHGVSVAPINSCKPANSVPHSHVRWPRSCGPPSTCETSSTSCWTTRKSRRSGQRFICGVATPGCSPRNVSPSSNPAQGRVGSPHRSRSRPARP